MSETQTEIIGWSSALVIFTCAAISPRFLFTIISAGHAKLSSRTVIIFRILGLFCLVGTAYRLVEIARR